MIPGPPRRGISAHPRTTTPSQSPPTPPILLAFPTANPSLLHRLARRPADAIGCSCSRGPGSPPGSG